MSVARPDIAVPEIDIKEAAVDLLACLDTKVVSLGVELVLTVRSRESATDSSRHRDWEEERDHTPAGVIAKTLCSIVVGVWRIIKVSPVGRVGDLRVCVVDDNGGPLGEVCHGCGCTF